MGYATTLSLYNAMRAMKRRGCWDSFIDWRSRLFEQPHIPGEVAVLAYYRSGCIIAFIILRRRRATRRLVFRLVSIFWTARLNVVASRCR